MRYMLDVDTVDCKHCRMVVFPDPEEADAEGLLATGGDLSPQTLLSAYRHGVFPWYEAGGPILWWNPDPRMVLFPASFHCSRRLSRRMRKGYLNFTIDKDFSGVVRGCADRSEGTWIHSEMMQAYQRLFDIGYAHSLEVWRGNELVGGLYGVQIGRVFFAESMFSCITDASKMALAQLVWLGEAEAWSMIDCQFYTEHLASLGAQEVSRAEFLKRLEEGIKRPPGTGMGRRNAPDDQRA